MNPLVILILCTVFQNTCECYIVEIALFINGRLAEELVHFFVCKPVAHSGEQLPQELLLNHTCVKKQFHSCRCFLMLALSRYLQIKHLLPNNVSTCQSLRQIHIKDAKLKQLNTSAHLCPPRRSRRKHYGSLPRDLCRSASLRTSSGTW